MTLYILLIIASYLLGSISSAVWISKRFYHIDIREHGSHNAGATNMLRVLGRRAALPVFVIDSLKGFTGVMLCHLTDLEAGSDALFNLKIALVAAAVLGHIFPIFAKFKGGKGVATLAGAVLAVYPSAVLICLAIFVITLAITHYVSLGSILGGISFPLLLLLLFGERSTSLIVFSIVIACLLVLTHRKNIKRLLDHSESKIYLFKKKG